VAHTPFSRIDHLVIAVRDLDAATERYAAMLGRTPSWRGGHRAYGTANALFGLGNCYLELLALATDAPSHPVAVALAGYLARKAEGVFAVALGSDDLDATAAHLRRAGLHPTPIMDGDAHDAAGGIRRWRSFGLSRDETRGVNVIAIMHEDANAIRPAPTVGAPRSVVTGVDHLVIFSDDLASALALWSGTFGIAERWRTELRDRGTVTVGLRLDGVTLEVVGPLDVATGTRGERTWGLAYDVEDVDAAVARIRGTSVAVSDARTGIAPGTRVCTVKWPDAVPTLLIEHRDRGRRSPASPQV
jgi:catechol 2,3-dioxygenase-like lactoylglutathione lyase family enzyme